MIRPGRIVVGALVSYEAQQAEQQSTSGPEDSPETPGEETLPDSGQRVENLPIEQPNEDYPEREGIDEDELFEQDIDEKPAPNQTDAPVPDLNEIDKNPDIDEVTN
ncbi:hypothetical protein [Sphingobacterium suaedae]|uniref:Uncharacterized protein n=1 Tax=Sphingobacterium suaedae TaxID=1686402 RepID=A0ABW5KGX5_9SPHI